MSKIIQKNKRNKEKRNFKYKPKPGKAFGRQLKGTKPRFDRKNKRINQRKRGPHKGKFTEVKRRKQK